MADTRPGKNWVRCFISHHPDILVAKPQGPEPKRAQNFNKATIMEYFGMHAPLNQKEHDWSVYDKRCQIDGGRNGDNSQLIFSIEEQSGWAVNVCWQLAIWLETPCYDI